MDFYREPLDHLISQLKTNTLTGLSQKDAEKRLRKMGANALPIRPPERVLMLFFKQLNNAFSYLLIIAALLKYFVEGYRDALIITIIIIINALVSALQEGRAAQTLTKLRSFLKTDCLVLRDGEMALVDQTALVPGDIMVLYEGMRVPADARIIEGQLLRVDESVLTGESTPVTKQVGTISTANLPVSEQVNMVFMGSAIVSGHAHALVVATGKRAYIGQLTEAIDPIERDLPLKRDLAHLSYFLLRAVIGIILIFLLIGLLRGKDAADLIFTMTSLLVSIVPEGIPIVSTILMARNAYLMAKSHVLVKRLQAIDGLGRMQVLVVDKTGTLTKNEQMVSRICLEKKTYTVTGSGYLPDGIVSAQIGTAVGAPVTPQQGEPLWILGLAGALLDDAELIRDEKSGNLRVRGEPIQAALGIAAHKMGFDREAVQQQYPKIAEIPFSSDHPLHQVLFKIDESKNLVVVMGGPERVATYCTGSAELGSDAKELLAQGFRVIAVAYRFTTGETFEQSTKNSYTIGLFGLNDTIREDAAASISAVQELGVRVLVATGDHLQTALHAAQATGIYTGPESVQERRGPIDGLEGIAVLARVTPQEKLKIIGHLQEKKLLVGMIGDGVNDVPALVAADVGIAMGISGTDVAKEAAAIVLLDDSLASIAEGIRLGRHAFLTMRQVLIFALATSAAEIIAFAVALLADIPLPLLATQILWVHMLTDGLLTIALGMESVDRQTTTVPLEPHVRLVDRRMARAFVLTSVPVAVTTLGLFVYYLPTGLVQARTVALTVLAMGQWWNAWNMRSETASIFSRSPFKNGWLLGGTVLVVIAQLGALYVPLLQKTLYTVPLSAYDFGLCLGISSLVLWIEEARKFLCRRA